MGVDFDWDRFLATAFWPLVAGSAAAFCFLAILAYTHLRSRALIDLLRRAVIKREKQEEMKRRIGTAPLLPRYQRFEKGLRDLLAREGLQAPPPPPPPAPAPAKTSPGGAR